jgi:hypothetical protein
MYGTWRHGYTTGSGIRGAQWTRLPLAFRLAQDSTWNERPTSWAATLFRPPRSMIPSGRPVGKSITCVPDQEDDRGLGPYHGFD